MAVEVEQNLGHTAENNHKAMTYAELELRNVASRGSPRKQVETERVANLVGKNSGQTVEATPFVSNVVARAQAGAQGAF